MNKKLVKTRVSRTNTLEAMACTCTCTCTCVTECVNCAGGGSWQASEHRGKVSNVPSTRSTEGSTAARRQIT